MSLSAAQTVLLLIVAASAIFHAQECSNLTEICPQGEFLNGSECRECPPGAFCPDLSGNFSFCTKNAEYATGGNVQCDICEPGHYVSRESSVRYGVDCRVCEIGFACPDGEIKQSCEKPLYTDSPGQQTCQTCSEGSIISTMPIDLGELGIACELCPNGQWSSTNSSECFPCPANYSCFDGVKTDCTERPLYPRTFQPGGIYCGSCHGYRYLTLRKNASNDYDGYDCMNCRDFYECPGDTNIYPCVWSNPLSNDQQCSGNGNCTEQNTCDCQDSYIGDICADPHCYGVDYRDPITCSSHGECLGNDRCECDSGYTGTNCQYKKPWINLEHVVMNEHIGPCSDLIIDAREAVSPIENQTLHFVWSVPPGQYLVHMNMPFPHFRQLINGYGEGGLLHIPHDAIDLPPYIYPFRLVIRYETDEGTVWSSFGPFEIEKHPFFIPLAQAPPLVQKYAGQPFRIEANTLSPPADCSNDSFDPSQMQVYWSSNETNFDQLVSMESMKTKTLLVDHPPEEAVHSKVTFHVIFSSLYFGLQTNSTVRVEIFPRKPRFQVVEYPSHVVPTSEVNITLVSASYVGDVSRVNWLFYRRHEGERIGRPSREISVTRSLTLSGVSYLEAFGGRLTAGEYQTHVESCAQVENRDGPVGESVCFISQLVEEIPELAVQVKHVDNVPTHDGRHTSTNAYPIFNPATRQVFEAHATFHNSTLTIQDLTFSWFIASSKWGGQRVALNQVDELSTQDSNAWDIRSPANESFIVFGPDQFEYGHSYTLHVDVLDLSGHVFDTGSQDIDLSHVPKNGILQVFPPTGLGLETKFVATTFGWETDSRLLEYQFSFVDEQQRERIIHPFSSVHRVSFYLPDMCVHNTSTPVEIKVLARDEDGMVSTQSMNLEMKPYASEADVQRKLLFAQHLLDQQSSPTWTMNQLEVVSSFLSEEDERMRLNTTSIRDSMVIRVSSLVDDGFVQTSDVQRQVYHVLDGVTSKPLDISPNTSRSVADLLQAESSRARQFAFSERTTEQLLTVCSNMENVLLQHQQFSLNNLKGAPSFETDTETLSVYNQLENATNTATNDLYNSQYPGESMRVISSKTMEIGAYRAGSRWKEVISSPSRSQSSARPNVTTSSLSLKIPTSIFGTKDLAQRAGVQFKLQKDQSFARFIKTGNVSSHVLSLDLLADDKTFAPDQFADPLEFSIAGNYDLSIIEKNERNDGIRPVCGYWNSTTQSWSTNGVELVSYSSSKMTCATNHTTDFSILLNFVPTPNIIDFNVITGEDSIIHLNEDNYTTTIVIFVVWVIYLLAMVGLEGWYTCSWFIRQQEQTRQMEKTLKIGGKIDGRRQYIVPLYQKFRDLHLWLSVFLLPSVEHQNSTRSQRLTLLVVLFLGISLSNAMSIGIDDEVQYWITCVMADFIVMPFVGIPWFLFSKLKRRQVAREDETREVHAKKSGSHTQDVDGRLASTTAGQSGAESKNSFPLRTLRNPQTIKQMKQTRDQLIRQFDAVIDQVVQLLARIDLRVTGILLLVFGSLLYFSLVAVGAYVILLVQWLGPIGTSILVVGSITAYIGIISELYLQSKLKAFRKGKLSWHNRWTPFNVVCTLIGLMIVLAGGGATIAIITTQNEQSGIDPSFRLGISTVIGVFMFGMTSIACTWLYRNLRTPQLNKKKSRMAAALGSRWFPWWFRAPIYVICWTMMVVASWFLVMYGIKFSRESAEGDFFFAITAANSQNAFLDNPSGIILSTIVTAILLKLFQTFFFPQDRIVGSSPANDLEEQEELEEKENFDDEVPSFVRWKQKRGTQTKKRMEVQDEHA